MAGRIGFALARSAGAWNIKNKDELMSNIESPEGLAAVQAACRELVARSAYCVDQQDYQAFAELFAEDGRLARPGGAWLSGRAEILASYQGRPADRITRHVVGNTVFIDTQAGSAKAVSYLVLWSTSAGEAVEAFGRKANARQVLGEFHDSFVKTEQGWRIAQREAEFIMYKDQ